MKVKLKPHTSEIIEQIADKSGVPINQVREVFHSLWKDTRLLQNHGNGHSISVERFGTFFLNVHRTNGILKLKMKFLEKRFATFSRIRKNNPEHVGTVARYLKEVLRYCSDIILIIESLKAYEKEVREKFPRKFKSDSKAIEEYSKRLEQLFGVPISSIEVTITDPIQKVFVQKLRKSGFLPNSVVYKNQKV